MSARPGGAPRRTAAVGGGTRVVDLRPRVLAVAALLAAALPSHLAAQDPPQRARLDSLDAAFAKVSDTTALLALEAARIEYAKAHRDDPMIHLELGILAYRIGELAHAAPGGSTKHYDDAAGEFEWASDLKADWPTPWYWLGRAELAIGEARFIPMENIREVLGQDALSKAARGFAHAAAVDPSYSRALVDLATTALRQRIAPRLDVAQRALRLAALTPAGHEPPVLLARGRVELELDALDSALTAFRGYLAAGGDSGVGGLEVARTLALLGQGDSAVDVYFAAARRNLGPEARARFRDDLAWIATPEELAAYDALPADSAGPWLRRFWGERDVEDARRPGERLAEQFRRYAYARANFRLTSRHRHYDIADAYRDSSQAEFDDRGVIYMRHGEPDARARYSDQYVEPNETWLYRRPPPDADLIFNFVATGHVQDYKLVESLLDAYGFSSAVIFQARQDVPNALFAELFNSRATLSPLYQRLAQGAGARGPLLSEERQLGRRAIARGTTTDDYALRFTHDLSPVISSFVLADRERRPMLHVVFALPAAALRSFPAPGGVGFPFEFRLIVYDAAWRQVAGLDTLRVFRSPTELPEGSYLTEQLAVPVPPGDYHYHFVVEELQSDAGAVVRGEPLAVPRTDAAFTASDLVVGRIGSGLALRRADGDDIPLNPLGRYPRDGTLELYYEIYGLPRGTAVGTRVSVQPAGGRSFFQRLFGGGRGANLAYSTVTDSTGRAAVRQHVGLVGLSPGRYTLTVELEDEATHRRLRRHETFDIENTRAP